MPDYGNFCQSKNCEHFIAWSFSNYCEDPYYCESCKLVGQSHFVGHYPDNCPHIDEIKLLDVSETPAKDMSNE